MNKRIIGYVILYQYSVMDLQNEVKKFIGDGWQPLGGVAVSKQGLDMFFQAMVKYEA